MLGDRGRAIALTVAHGDAEALRGRQVDIVGAGGGYQNQFQIRQCRQGFGSQRHLVADGHLCALQAFDYLPGMAGVVLGQAGEGLLQWAQIEIPQIERSAVEKDGMTTVHG